MFSEDQAPVEYYTKSFGWCIWIKYRNKIELSMENYLRIFLAEYNRYNLKKITVGMIGLENKLLQNLMKIG